MAEIGTFDILSLLTSYLRDVTGVPVASEVPEERPARFVSVFRDGGARVDVRFDTPRITIWAWGESEADAYALVNQVRTAMAALPSIDPRVTSVLETTTRINNHSSGHRRYEAGFVLRTTS